MGNNPNNRRISEAKIGLQSLVNKTLSTDKAKIDSSKFLKRNSLRLTNKFKDSVISRTLLNDKLTSKNGVNSALKLLDLLDNVPLKDNNSLSLYTATLLPTIYTDETNSTEKNQTDFYTNQILKIEKTLQDDKKNIEDEITEKIKKDKINKKKMKENLSLSQLNTSSISKSQGTKIKRVIRSFQNTNRLDSSFLVEKLKLNTSERSASQDDISKSVLLKPDNKLGKDLDKETKDTNPTNKSFTNGNMDKFIKSMMNETLPLNTDINDSTGNIINQSNNINIGTKSPTISSLLREVNKESQIIREEKNESDEHSNRNSGNNNRNSTNQPKSPTFNKLEDKTTPSFKFDVYKENNVDDVNLFTEAGNFSPLNNFKDNSNTTTKDKLKKLTSITDKLIERTNNNNTTIKNNKTPDPKLKSQKSITPDKNIKKRKLSFNDKDKDKGRTSLNFSYYEQNTKNKNLNMTTNNLNNSFVSLSKTGNSKVFGKTNRNGFNKTEKEKIEKDPIVNIKLDLRDLIKEEVISKMFSSTSRDKSKNKSVKPTNNTQRETFSDLILKNKMSVNVEKEKQELTFKVRQQKKEEFLDKINKYSKYGESMSRSRTKSPNLISNSTMSSKKDLNTSYKFVYDSHTGISKKEKIEETKDYKNNKGKPIQGKTGITGNGKNKVITKKPITTNLKTVNNNNTNKAHHDSNKIATAKKNKEFGFSEDSESEDKSVEKAIDRTLRKKLYQNQLDKGKGIHPKFKINQTKKLEDSNVSINNSSIDTSSKKQGK